MLDAAAGGHPLGLALGDDAAAAGGVAVGELAVEHVGDGLEASVRVPLGAFRLARAVQRGAGVVEQEEGVGVGHRQRAGERAADGHAGAFGAGV